MTITEKETEKRVCSRGSWAGLNPEILALIFVRIPADEMARAVPLVCRSWSEVVSGPYCWAHIDVEQWCRRCNRADVIDTAVCKLVRCSKGTVRSLSAYKLGDSAFSFVANFGKCLKVLKIPLSDVTDETVAKHAASLSTITDLDISYCLKITCNGIELLGQHCKSLFCLKRNLPPVDFEAVYKAVEDEALAVADTMPRLCHLELGYGHFSDCGLDAILTKCKDLHHLDIQGCWNVNFDGDLGQRCERVNVFRGPDDDEYDNASISEDSGSGGTGSDTEDTHSECYSYTCSDDSN